MFLMQKKQRSVQMMAEVEWLRPLVKDGLWDYCVIWKLGDDPSRFIEWEACCCSGGQEKGRGRGRGRGVKIKDEIVLNCKDTFLQHPITTKACTKLANLPSLIPLYSGIHGDAVITQRPQWINPDDEWKGTRVVIPIDWGLIELFTTKEVPEDEKIIDYISSGFKFRDKQENMREEEEPCEFHILPSLKNLILSSQPNNYSYSSFEGSSTCSSLSNEHQILKPENSNTEMKRKKQTADCVKNWQKAEKGPYKSKNLITERKRRKRIKDGMLVLRGLVPKITKMDRLATLGDSADYIKELLASIQNFRDQLRELEDEDRYKVQPKQGPTLFIKDRPSELSPIVAEVEVNQIGRKDFLIRLVCKQRREGFSRLMEAVDSLGLQVTDVNITTLNGLVLNNIKVEAKTNKDVQVNTLKHSLVELLIN